MTEKQRVFLTREQLRRELNARGYPMSASYFNKICLPSINAGPPASKTWGKRPLYKLDEGIAWAESRDASSLSVSGQPKPAQVARKPSRGGYNSDRINRKMVSFWIPVEMHRHLKITAARNGQSIIDEVLGALTLHLEGLGYDGRASSMQDVKNTDGPCLRELWDGL